MAFSRHLEIKTIQKMIMMYCHDQHNTKKDELCYNCMKLFKYAEQRIDKCFYGDNKPVCSKCTVHCYKPEMRARIKEVMQYSGPRMMWKSPILSLRYMYRKTFKSNI
ncbi:MAG: nitrous oxide-stimulated promoter family protein [Eubacteriales bacterium]|nr:nitrous oxide-stimulated promoter family protein [Eubacteriales bacterium]